MLSHWASSDSSLCPKYTCHLKNHRRCDVFGPCGYQAWIVHWCPLVYRATMGYCPDVGGSKSISFEWKAWVLGRPSNLWTILYSRNMWRIHMKIHNVYAWQKSNDFYAVTWMFRKNWVLQRCRHVFPSLSRKSPWLETCVIFPNLWDGWLVKQYFLGMASDHQPDWFYRCKWSLGQGLKVSVFNPKCHGWGRWFGAPKSTCSLVEWRGPQRAGSADRGDVPPWEIAMFTSGNRFTIDIYRWPIMNSNNRWQ